MNEREILAIFEELEECESSADAHEFVFAHPVLLSPEWQARFSAVTKKLPEVTQVRADQVLRLLALTVKNLRQDMSRYPIGTGPLERLYRLVRKGEITESRGLELASQSDTYRLLGLVYVRMLSIHAERAARGGDWKTGLLIQKLILSALEARRSELVIDQATMDFCATVHWLDIVARAVWDVPDGRLFHDAVGRGEALANTVDDPGGFYAPGEILHRLGVLHLDPYVYSRTTQDYDLQWGLWQDRLAQSRATEYGGESDDASRLPPVKEALPKAAEYLRRAAVVRKGVSRGLTLKALLQALVWQHVAGISPETAEVHSVASEALSLLPTDRYAEPRAEIESLTAWDAQQRADKTYTKDLDLSETRLLLEKPIKEWLKVKEPREIIGLFTQSASAVSEKDPRLAMDLWLAVLPLIGVEDEQLKGSHFRLGVQFVRDALVPADASKLEGQTIIERAEAAAEMSQSKSWDDQTRAAVLLSLAMDSTTSDEEEAGLELLGRAAEASPELASVLYPLLMWLKGVLETGAGVNALNRSETKEAARYYMMSAATFLNGQQPRMAMELIKWTVDLGLSRDPDALHWFIVGVCSIALDLEDQLGDSVMASLQYHYRQVFARLVQQKVKPLLLLFFLQAAKGNRLSNALARGGQAPWLETPAAQNMLRAINELGWMVRSELSFSSILDDEMLLTAYISSGEMKGGATGIERLRNLQIRFDAELNRELARQPSSAPEWIPTIESLQETLGPRSVLLCYFLGMGPQTGGFAIYTLVLTDQDVKLIGGESNLLPSATVTISDGEERIAGNWLSLDIQELRKAVQMEPGPRSASGEALDALAKDVGQYLGGGLAELLTHLQETGKDHLCIAPHGPLHYYPFHLLGPEDEPLLKNWSVTYLPNLRLLVGHHDERDG
jgi:hypothetical protein